MVKKLFLVRHAQAAESEQGMKDIERYLTRSGMREAVHTGMYLKRHKLTPDLIISSSALRAASTSQIIAEQLKYNQEEILVEPELYEASVRILLKIINELDVNCQSVLLVAHNPSISYFGELLTKEPIGSMETGSLVEVHFPMDSWKEVSQNTGKFIRYVTPAEIEAEENNHA